MKCMRKLTVMCLGFLMAVSVLHAQESKGFINVHPSQIELDTKDSSVDIGFGLLESEGNKTKIWNVLPVRLVVSSGKNKIVMGLNGISFLTWENINFSREKTVKGVYKGDVVSVAGPVKILGRVEGNVYAFGANIILGEGSRVTGDVVALGGEITAYRNSYIEGNKQSVPQFNIPLLGVLSSPQSAETILFILDILSILLFLGVLFLVIQFKTDYISGLIDAAKSQWKSVILYLLIGVMLLPLLIMLLIVSIIGVYVIPLLFLTLIILGYLGFTAMTVMVGQFFIRNNNTSPLRLFLCGLCGILVLKGPVILGRLLSLVTSDMIIFIGGIFKFIGAVILITATVFGLGVAVKQMKEG